MIWAEPCYDKGRKEMSVAYDSRATFIQKGVKADAHICKIIYS